MLPSFIIGGIQKCGTTYLDSLVRSHPDVWMLNRDYKRNSFFDDDEIYRNGADWYQGLFAPAPKGRIVGQTSADCAYNERAASRLKQVLPNVKLIFILRHPIDRAYSLYWHQVRMGREISTFEDAILLENDRIRKGGYHMKKFPYLARSRYKTQFDNLARHIPKQNILLIPFEMFIKNEVMFLNLVFDFIGASRINSLSDLKYVSPKMNPAKVPSSKMVLKTSYYLQQFGLVSIGRRLLNSNLVEQRPPRINEATAEKIATMLSEDVSFYDNVVLKYRTLNSVH